MLDLTKTYTTRDGKRVYGLTYVPYNSVGEKVTYPIKGTIVVREKPLKTKYEIWSEDGKVDVVFGKRSNCDLISVDKLQA